MNLGIVRQGAKQLLVKAFIDGDDIGQQVVVVAAGRHNFIQRFGLSHTDIVLNALFGADLSHRDGSGGDHGKQAEANGIATDRLQ